MSAPAEAKPGEARQRSTTRIRKSLRPGHEPSRYKPGDLIAGKYELIRPRGQGGMGSVWVAYNRVLDVEVAIKLIALDPSGSAAVHGQRLLDEARAAARLGHPSIIRIQDFGLTALDDPFMAMELLNGEDLADLLGQRPTLPPVEAVQMMIPIAHALSAAHERGIVHRDVKPENIFLAADDGAVVPKLLDFGIAHTVDRPERLTLHGALLGTPDYMSPEQARGESVGPSSDVWSLCVVLYEMICGTCPFEGANFNLLLCEIVGKEPPPLEQHGVTEPELWAILSRGLHKDVQQRFGSMRALGEALARWLVERGVMEDVTGTSLRRSFLRDLEPSGRFELSQLTHSGLLKAPSVDERSAPRANAPPAREVASNSDADLAAIAELSRGGDPVEIIERQARRRVAQVVVGFTLLAVALAAGILFGTGIIGG